MRLSFPAFSIRNNNNTQDVQQSARLLIFNVVNLSGWCGPVLCGIWEWGGVFLVYFHVFYSLTCFFTFKKNFFKCFQKITKLPASFFFSLPQTKAIFFEHWNKQHLNEKDGILLCSNNNNNVSSGWLKSTFQTTRREGTHCDWQFLVENISKKACSSGIHSIWKIPKSDGNTESISVFICLIQP